MATIDKQTEQAIPVHKSREELAGIDHSKPGKFLCSRCGETYPLQSEGGTGYAHNDKGELLCYLCCAVIDRQYMLDNGRIALYLSQKKHRHLVEYWEITNWPNALRFPVLYRKRGEHNIAGKRTDVYFIGPDGREWWGVNYGDNSQIVHCKRTKGDTFADRKEKRDWKGFSLTQFVRLLVDKEGYNGAGKIGAGSIGQIGSLDCPPVAGNGGNFLCVDFWRDEEKMVLNRVRVSARPEEIKAF